jgi:hypothetical protein
MHSFFKPHIVAVLLLGLISGCALFAPPLIGLADNGDFGRIMLPNGLRHEGRRDSNDYFGYFNYRFDRLQYYNEVKGDKSTHSIIIRAAMGLDDLFSRDDKFDIRFLALIGLAVLAWGIYWLVEVTGRMLDSKVFRYVMALVAVVIFGDIGYTVYFNSFFGEGVAYPFFFLSISSLLKFSADKDARMRYVVVFLISSLIFIGSKNQYSLNGILCFFILVSMLPLKLPNWKKGLTVILGGGLLVLSLLMYREIDQNIFLINKYHTVTRGVMLFEPDAQKITKKLGLDEQFSLLAGTIYFDKTPAIDPQDEILLDNFYSKYDVFSIALYYLKNPGAFSKIMKFGLKNSLTIRPEVLGNYTRDSGRRWGERTNFFSVWSYIKENQVPNSAGFIYFFLIICLIMVINRLIKYRNVGAPQLAYYSEIVMFYLFLTGFSQVLISFIGAGDTDLKKHLFLTTVTWDILFYYNFTYLVSLMGKRRNPPVSLKRSCNNGKIG